MKSAEERLYDDIWEAKIDRERDLAVDGSLRADGAARLIEPGKRLLDIGSGEGSFILRVRSSFEQVFGIDISERTVELANKQGIHARQANLNNEPVPFPDAYFDAVVSLDVIEHVFDPITFLKEIHRALAPGGYTIISTPNIRKIQRIASLVMGHFPRTSYDPVGFDGGHLHYFTSRDIRQLMESTGFRVEHTQGLCGD
jgi:2-polyprenyl-6-hydroxyphenyl methylase/3-demethylubiquinone-9 3-methyltransferase